MTEKKMFELELGSDKTLMFIWDKTSPDTYSVSLLESSGEDTNLTPLGSVKKEDFEQVISSVSVRKNPSYMKERKRQLQKYLEGFLHESCNVCKGKGCSKCLPPEDHVKVSRSLIKDIIFLLGE